MAKIAPLSGFPEHLPAAYLVEQLVIDSLRHTFELHGFAGLETRAVEPLEQLLRKGETSKEIYRVSRLQGEDAAAPARSRSELGLRFDLTVPFARYVLENAGRLQFPFRRYQIQRVWRGERPQEGRFREFVQADIDVVGQGTLPAHYEVEVPLVMADAFRALRAFGVPPVLISINNRKVVQGFYQGLGLTDVEAVLRAVDKLDKIGPAEVSRLLGVEAGATAEQAEACLRLAEIRGGDLAALERARDLAAGLGADTPLFNEGMAELEALLRAASARAPGVVAVDFKIARGLDYYTGAVYETALVGHEDLGSICSGGRYDSLASDGKQSYPGVGLSIGVSRLVARLLSAGLVVPSRPVRTAVLVAVNAESSRGESDQVAAALRERGISAEVSPTAAKYGKQIQFAARRGIPFVWFPDSNVGLVEGAGGPGKAAGTGSAGPRLAGQVKDIRSGEQVPADAATWEPPAADARVALVPGQGQPAGIA